MVSSWKAGRLSGPDRLAPTPDPPPTRTESVPTEEDGKTRFQLSARRIIGAVSTAGARSPYHLHTFCIAPTHPRVAVLGSKARSAVDRSVAAWGSHGNATAVRMACSSLRWPEEG